MGLKCQLLGHAYGNPEVERSREEQGDEVVVTVRNVKVCERCGDEQMVNQTKEVTSVRSPDEVGLDTAESPSTAEPAEQPSDDAPEPVAGEADASDSPVTPVEPDAAGSATPDPEPSSGGESGTPVEADLDGEDPAVEPAVDRIDDDIVADATVSAPAADDATTPAEDVDDPDSEPADVTEAADDTDASAETTADDGWETGSDDWDDVDPDIDDAVILDTEGTARDEVQWPEEPDADPEGVEETEAEWAGETAASDDAAPDDTEIIDAGEDTADAEWPTHDDESTGAWPDHDDTDEGFSAAPNGDVEAEFDGEGLTPEANGSATADSTGADGVAVRASNGYAAGDSGAVAADAAATEANAEADEGFVRATESGAEDADVPDGRVEFYCPNCGYAQAAGTSSMRAGDICPECKRGYIAEREV